MAKSVRRRKKSRSRKISRKKNHIRIRKHRAGSRDKVKCSICEKNVDVNDTFISRECLTKHGIRAHRICKDCWWDMNNGFALEASSHKCPGCQKGLPLTHAEPVFMDLTED